MGLSLYVDICNKFTCSKRKNRSCSTMMISTE